MRSHMHKLIHARVGKLSVVYLYIFGYLVVEYPVTAH